MNYLKSSDLYLERYGYPSTILEDKYGSPDMVIVIPSYKEEGILQTLESLLGCATSEVNAEVLVVINYSESSHSDIKERSMKTFDSLKKWSLTNNKNHIRFLIAIVPDLPAKHAGVGLARKIGLDEAVRRVRKDTILVCLDADCTVADNYIEQIHNHFQEHTNSPGASIYYEHPKGEGIDDYELHLRYFNMAQRYAGFPWAYHTVGSSMAFRSSAYIKQGGMNRRKAGEDFYFLHKIIALGGFSEINQTSVFPSARQSDRVPFGTGHAMNKWDNDGQQTTYPLYIFRQLQQLTSQLDYIHENRSFPKLPTEISVYLEQLDSVAVLNEILAKSPNFLVFRKHFFRWLDAFKIMKYCNQFERVPILEASSDLLKEHSMHIPDSIGVSELLDEYRSWERGSHNYLKPISVS